MDSILTTIKKTLGIDEKDKSFDLDLIVHINSVFMVLNQLGVGPEEGFYIEDEYATWDEFIDEGRLNLVKSYMYLKVRLLFDPPVNSSLIESINRMINEFEWRLNVAVDPKIQNGGG